MEPPSSADRRRPFVMVWDWPLRVWHWAFALSLTGSLVTGLIGDIAWIDWHLRLGYAAVGLLLFRFAWALWGGRYARWHTFRTSPGRLLAFLRGSADAEVAPRTAPGVVLVLLLLAAATLQAVSGLFTTDEIFTEGPLVRHAGADLVDTMSWLHHRVFWVLLGLIGVHLLAHLVYAVRRDPTPLSMFTGRKRLAVEPASQRGVLGLVTAAAVTAAVWWTLAQL